MECLCKCTYSVQNSVSCTFIKRGGKKESNGYIKSTIIILNIVYSIAN